MPSREASLKVTLRPGAFNSGIRRMTGTVRQAGVAMGHALKGPMIDGFKGAGRAAADLASSVKNTVASIATLGGAVSGGALIKSAIDAEAAYVQLDDQLASMVGRAVDSQAMIERVASKTKGSLDDTRQALNQLAGVGDVDLIESSLERATKQAKRLGVPVDLVARATSRVLTKGLASSADEAEILLEKMNKFGKSVLGVDPDEALDPNDIAEYAAFVNRTNSNVDEMFGLLSKTGGKVKDMGQAFEIIEELGEFLNTRKGLAELRKASGLNQKQLNMTKGTVGNLLSLMESGSPKAVKALEDALGPNAKTAIADIFGQEFMIKLAGGKVSKQEIRDLGKNLSDELSKAGDNAAIRNRIAESDAKHAETSSAKLQDAMNKLEMTFAQPKMVDAINKLADKLPVLVEAVGNAAEYILDNPWDSLAMVVGGKLALAFGGSMIQSAISRGVASMFAKGAAMQAASAAAGGGVTSAVAGGGLVAGVTGAATLAAGAAAAGAAGVGTGMLIDKVTGSLGSEKEYEAQRRAQEAITQAGILGSGAKAGQIQAALLKLAEVKQGLNENKSIATTVFGGIASVVSDAESPEKIRAARLKEVNDAEARLRDTLEQVRNNANMLSGALSTVTRNVNTFASAATTRGPLNAPEAQPGAMPTGG